MAKVVNIAVLTSGGDSPGMNAAIRAVVRTGVYHGIKVVGIQDGYQGLIENRFMELSYSDVSYIIQRGGTILGTARSEEFFEAGGRAKAAANLRALQLEGLVVIGGDGTFAGARLLMKEFGTNVIGLPGTIDNDVYGTDYTIGFDTAMNTVIDSIDKLRDTASSHHRIFLVEVMGRNSATIAMHAALSSGAEDVFLPGVAEDLSSVTDRIQRAINAGKSSIIVVAEGDESRGAMAIMQNMKSFGWADKLRVSILGHIQRGGAPSYLDRLRATLLGNRAVTSLMSAKRDIMLGFKGSEMVEVPFADLAKASPDTSESFSKLIKVLSVY